MLPKAADAAAAATGAAMEGGGASAVRGEGPPCSCAAKQRRRRLAVQARTADSRAGQKRRWRGCLESKPAGTDGCCGAAASRGGLRLAGPTAPVPARPTATRHTGAPGASPHPHPTWPQVGSLPQRQPGGAVRHWQACAGSGQPFRRAQRHTAGPASLPAIGHVGTRSGQMRGPVGLPWLAHRGYEGVRRGTQGYEAAAARRARHGHKASGSGNRNPSAPPPKHRQVELLLSATAVRHVAGWTAATAVVAVTAATGTRALAAGCPWNCCLPTPSCGGSTADVWPWQCRRNRAARCGMQYVAKQATPSSLGREITFSQHVCIPRCAAGCALHCQGQTPATAPPKPGVGRQQSHWQPAAKARVPAAEVTSTTAVAALQPRGAQQPQAAHAPPHTCSPPLCPRTCRRFQVSSGR